MVSHCRATVAATNRLITATLPTEIQVKRCLTAAYRCGGIPVWAKGASPRVVRNTRWRLVPAMAANRNPPTKKSQIFVVTVFRRICS